jgi:hypothetical protein
MKYALFEFVEENSLCVGESAWICDLDEQWRNNEMYDFDAGEVEVMWPRTGGKGKTKLYSALVLQFSGKFY